MEIVFEKDYLSTLYYKGDSGDKKHRFQPQIVKKYINTVNLLESIQKPEDLYRYHALNYEKLIGDKAGTEFVRINDKYRIEFKTYPSEKETRIVICSIIELSNHYK